jgi:hypothetical protein
MYYETTTSASSRFSFCSAVTSHWKGPPSVGISYFSSSSVPSMQEEYIRRFYNMPDRLDDDFWFRFNFKVVPYLAGFGVRAK